jgi:hypothetical protein
MTEFERRLRDKFEDNYEYLKGLEGGHLVTESVKETAFLQVLYYYRRNKELIERITHSEVKLNLPEQRTPRLNYRYSIEGEVDIVREGDETYLYDIKTTDRQNVLDHIDQYRGQMNVYAYIYSKLQGNRLDKLALITTALPQELVAAINSQDQNRIGSLMRQWDPVVPMGYSEDEIEHFIQQFGKVVEHIEEGEFTAPPVERLSTHQGRRGSIFAIEVCRNCDVRFSCSSWKRFQELKTQNPQE